MRLIRDVVIPSRVGVNLIVDATLPVPNFNFSQFQSRVSHVVCHTEVCVKEKYVHLLRYQMVSFITNLR